MIPHRSRCASWRTRVLGPTVAILLGLIGSSARLSAQPPQGLAASALADTSFRWVRDSVPGIRAYFLRGTYPFTHRDSLLARLPRVLAEAQSLLGAPPLPGPLDVFYVESREQMRSLVGAAVTGFAHTAARAVFVVTNPDWRVFDRHEVMHIVAAQAWTPIGGRNAWLQEGLAQAADGRCGGYTNTAVAMALAARDGWIDLGTLIGRFREQSDLRAYLQAASFVSYLLREVGPEGVRSLWLAEVTPATELGGATLLEWERRWRSSLGTTEAVPPATLARIDRDGCGIR